MEVESLHPKMTPLVMKSRNCLVDDIKCLETQLSTLQERFDIIVNWIRSEYRELNGLPHFVIVAVRGDKASIKEKLESTRDSFSVENIEHVKVESEIFDDDVSLSLKLESDDQIENSVDKLEVDVLKDIEFQPVSSKLPDGDRQLFDAEEDDTIWKPLYEDNNEKEDRHSDNNDSKSPPAVRLIRSNVLKASKGDTRTVVKKTPLHFDVNREKGLILTASEYEEKVAPLPKERLPCAICGKKFPTSFRRRRHEIDVHLTKEEGLKVRSNILKPLRDLKESTKTKGDPKNVLKTSLHFEANREKGLILTAFEYKEKVASLSKERLNCAICGKKFPTSFRRRRHEIDVHLTKEEGLKVRTNIRKPLRDSKESTKTKGDPKNVLKTPLHFEVNREKGLILTAFEYKEKVASLSKERLTCAICPKDFATSIACRRHEIGVHLTKEEGLMFRNSISNRQETTNDVATLCDICHLSFKNIEAHKKNHLPAGVITAVDGSSRPHYRCLKCDSIFSEKKKYLTHAMTECKVTEMLDNSNSDQHTDEQHTEKNFLCNQCGQIFNRKYTLKVHELAVHANKRDFKCGFCDKRFVIEYRKKIHEKKHLGTGSVTCDLCGYSFRCKQILRKHIRGVHENRRPYKCPVCEKSFKTSTARNYHLNTHGNPNGRQRGLNRDVDPIRAAAKRRHCMVVKLACP